MKLNGGMTASQRKRLKKSSSESSGKKPTWVEYTNDIGLIKDTGRRAITNNHGNVGKINNSVKKIRGTF